MHQNKIWLLFLVLIVATTLWYTGETLYDIYFTYSLSEPHTPKIEKWDIFESEDEVFYPKVSYSFEKGDEKYSQTEILKEEVFPNPWALQDRYPEIIEKEWTVWCDPDQPHHCTLQKEFPFKRAIYSLILLAISLYFILLGRYVYRTKK